MPIPTFPLASDCTYREAGTLFKLPEFNASATAPTTFPPDTESILSSVTHAEQSRFFAVPAKFDCGVEFTF